MEGFQMARQDIESRSKYPACRWKGATCFLNNTLQQLTVNAYEVQKLCGLMGRFRLIISVYTSSLPPPGKKQNRGQLYFHASVIDSLAHRYVWISICPIKMFTFMNFWKIFSSRRKCIHKSYFFLIYVCGICSILWIPKYFLFVVLSEFTRWEKGENWWLWHDLRQGCIPRTCDVYRTYRNQWALDNS
jgi:hypothetical protein